MSYFIFKQKIKIIVSEFVFVNSFFSFIDFVSLSFLSLFFCDLIPLICTAKCVVPTGVVSAAKNPFIFFPIVSRVVLLYLYIFVLKEN